MVTLFSTYWNTLLCGSWKIWSSKKIQGLGLLFSFSSGRPSIFFSQFLIPILSFSPFRQKLRRGSTLADFFYRTFSQKGPGLKTIFSQNLKTLKTAKFWSHDHSRGSAFPRCLPINADPREWSRDLQKSQLSQLRSKSYSNFWPGPSLPEPLRNWGNDSVWVQVKTFDDN